MNDASFAHHVNLGMKKFPGMRVQGYGLNRFGERFVVSFVVAQTLEPQAFNTLDYLTSPEYKALLSRHVHSTGIQKNVTRLLMDRRRLGRFMATYLERVDPSTIQ